MLDTIISLTYAARLRALGIYIDPRTLESNGFKYVPRNSAYQFNPTDDFLRRYGYYPNVTVHVFRSKFDSSFVVDRLKVQCSYQRIIFDTSYYSPDGTYKDMFCNLLSEKLVKISIPVTAEKVRKLSVSEFAPSANIILPQHFGRPVGFLKKLTFLDVSKQFHNILNSEYSEEVEGFAYREYSQNTGFRIYDNGSSIRNHPKTLADLEVNGNIEAGLLPANIFRVEKTYQNKPTARKAIGKFIPKGSHDDIFLEDVLNQELCKAELLDTVTKIGNVFDLIVTDLGSEPQFLPIEYLWHVAKQFGLKGHEIAYFTNYALALQQMGRKNAVTLYDDVFGRTGQKQRCKYSSLINKRLGKVNLNGFFLFDLFEEIKTQISEFKPYTNGDEANAILAAAEKRQEQRDAKKTNIIVSAQPKPSQPLSQIPRLILPQQIEIDKPSQLRLMPELEVVQPPSAYRYH